MSGTTPNVIKGYDDKGVYIENIYVSQYGDMLYPYDPDNSEQSWEVRESGDKTLSLTDEQARFLRDRLNEMYPADEEDSASPPPSGGLAQRIGLSDSVAEFVERVESEDAYNGQVTRVFLKNGYGVSLAQHSYSHSDAHTSELAVIVVTSEGWDLDYSTPVTSDVMPYQTMEDIEGVIRVLASLPRQES